MKHWPYRFLPLLLPACMVDTPVVKGTNDMRLEDIGAWCASACEKIDQCGLFGGQEERDDCPGSCVDSFNRSFLGKNDICNASASRIMDCVDAASCEELGIDGVCNASSEAEHCARSQGIVLCSSTGEGSGGSAGFAGSAGTAGRSNFPCEFEYGDCSDAKTYRLECTDSPGLECQCFVDDEITNTFEPPRLECPTGSDAIELCDWPIEPPAGSDDGGGSGGAPGAILCDSASIGDGANECELSFDGCSNGVFYGLQCSGAPGEAVCTCVINGTTVSLAYTTGLSCDVLNNADVDSDAMMIHDACGFDLAIR